MSVILRYLSNKQNNQITESYAFLPRDAVTKFLAGCYVCKKSPRACSPSRLDDSYYTESSSEMDISSLSPKSLSDISITSSENPGVVSQPNQKNEMTTSTSVLSPATSLSMTSTMSTTIDNSKHQAKSEKELKTNMAAIDALAKSIEVSVATTAQLSSTSQNPSEPDYLDDVYAKISEYYRGIFSNIDLKDPNINADVLNYYQLIRQFYEQTMAANIQRNRALGIGTLAKAAGIDRIDIGKNSTDVSTIDLTISKPNLKQPFDDAKVNDSFANNININIENELNALNDVKSTKSHKAEDNLGENKVTINSAGVSINVSSLTSNSLKISCKTTPPKKRYSIYNVNEGVNNFNQSESNSMKATSAATDLNKKFNAIEMLNSNETSTISNAIGDHLPTGKSFVASKREKTITTKRESVASSSPGITDIIPITSTYLQLMRSMGFTEEDAMKFDNVVSLINLFSVFSFLWAQNENKSWRSLTTKSSFIEWKI